MRDGTAGGRSTRVPARAWRGRTCRRAAAVLVALVAAADVATGAPAIRVVEPRLPAGEGGAALAVTWEAGACTADMMDRDVVVRCAGAIDWRDPEGIIAARKEWVESVRLGYDSVLLRAARGVSWRMDAHASGLRLTSVEGTLTTGVAGAGGGSVDESGAIRLDLLRVQWLVSRGGYEDAARLLEGLGRRAPRHPDVLVARGQFERERGRRQEGEALFAEAHAAAPSRADIAQLVAGLEQQHRPRVEIESDLKDVSGGWREQATRMTLTAPSTGATSASLTLDRLQATAPVVRHESGVIGPLDVSTWRSEAVMHHEFAPGLHGAATLYGSPGGAGAAGSVSVGDLHGQTNFTAEVRRPFWEFLEGLADGGGRDKVEVQRQLRFDANTAAWIVGGFNRYRVGGAATTTSAALTVGAIRTVRRARPALTLQYGLDKEHRLDATVAVAPDGLRFTPIPLVSREVHLVGLVGVQEGGAGRVEGTVGYTLDRFGGRGAFLTGRVRTAETRRIGLDLFVDRRLYTITTTARVLRAGLAFTYRF
ncbi:MAG: hypothetical protein U0Q12_00560 [Vicinamibacterales bacterium]